MKAQAKERRAYRRTQSVQESAAADESTPADEGTAAGESEAAGTDESSDAGSTSSEETGGAEAADGSKASYNVTWDDMADVKMVLIAPGAIPPGLPEVEAAVNELTESQINTHVTIELLEMGNYIQQVSLKMSSNEQVDLLMTFPGGSATFSAMQSQGQLMAKNAPVSAYLGFTVDTTAITNEMSAVTNVVAEFSKQINTGLADESVLDDYRAKLETSGIQKIIDEYQRQLDAWIEANK